MIPSTSETILSETYFPDADNRIEIDVQDVVSRYLETQLPSTNAFIQESAVATFQGKIYGSTVATFAVVNGGVRKLSDTALQFITANWLTWQPQSKQVTWNSPEYLTYYFYSVGVVMARFYLKNGTTRDVTIHSQNVAGKIVTINTTMSRLFSLSGEETDDLYGIVDIWTETQSGTQLSYTQRYIHTETMGDEHYYLCVNSLGGIDTFTFHGACTLAPEISYESARKGGTKLDITTGQERKWQQNTGFAGMAVTKWLFELLAAPKQWAVVEGNAEPIVIDTSSLQMNDRDNLHACTFSFTLAEEGRLLNVSRTAGDLPSIEVPSPSGDLFFLSLRLADYPDAELEDTILFLVQSPYTESWSKASLGAIKTWLLNIINNSNIGQYAHRHDNLPQLDKISEIDGDMAYDGEKLQKASDAAVKFLRKDISDRSAGRISADRGLEAGTFNPGLTGSGAFIDENGAAEMKSLVLRSFLEVPELRYNRVSIEIGNKWNAPGGGIIEDVSVDTDAAGAPLMTGIITLHLEDGEIGTVEVDDICQGIFHDGLTLSNNAAVNWDDGRGNFNFAGFVTSYFRVTAILDSQHKRFRYALRGISDNWTSTFHPVPAMHFVGYGNFSNTDRQVSRYSTRTYERFLKGVNTWEFTSSNIAAQFGDLSNLSVLGMTGMTGYSAYLNNIYMSGTIEQIEDMDLRLEIDTNGDNFLAWGESLQLHCRVWRGGFFEEVTDDIVSWNITRDSGDAVDDAAWALKQKVQDFDGDIEICFNSTENDLGGGANTVSTLFTITASLLSGDTAQAEIVI